MASSTALSSGPNGVDFVKDTYIPIFSNRPADYREWRQRIMLYKKKSEINKKSREATINLMTSLSGIAWRQIEHLVEKASEAEDGFGMILAELDKTFKYDDQVEMPRAFEKFFYGVSRRDGQTLLNYVADHREALTEVEKHGVQIPDKVAGWILLRRAGLSTEQKQMIQGRASELTQSSVTESLYFLLGQDYKGRAPESRQWRGKGYGSNSTRWARHQGYMTEEPFDDDGEDWGEMQNDEMDNWDDWADEDYGDNEMDEAYYNEDAEETEMNNEFYTEAEQNYEDAYAAYLDARRQMANLRASRGFYPVVALTDTSSLPSSSPTSQAPISPKGRGKGKSKSKKGRGKGPSKWQTKGGQIPQRGQAASSKCLKCGQPGHWAANCPQKGTSTTRSSPATSTSPVKKAKTDGSAMMARDVAKKQHGIPQLGNYGWFGIQDGGASSVVVGHTTLMKIVDYMCQRGLPASRYLFIATDKTFGFGGDAQRQADWSVRLPVYING